MKDAVAKMVARLKVSLSRALVMLITISWLSFSAQMTVIRTTKLAILTPAALIKMEGMHHSRSGTCHNMVEWMEGVEQENASGSVGYLDNITPSM